MTLLAAAEASTKAAQTAGDKPAVLLAAAQKVLTEKDQDLLKSAQSMALLNQQLNQLRAQLGSLQAVLDMAAEKDSTSKVQIEALGSQLNAALAQVASEQKRRADLEEQLR